MAAGASPTAAAAAPEVVRDCFAAMNEPRRPWLDAEALKQKFLGLSGETHPDRVHHLPPAERDTAARRFAYLNAAYNCLRDPKPRLRHLLELERGARPAEINDIPAPMMDFAMATGGLCREVDAFLAEKSRVTSPLLQVAWFERGQEWTDKLRTIQHRIQDQLQQVDLELKAMNPAWEAAAAPQKLLLERLEEIYRLLGYLVRWADQLQERIVKLSL